MFSMLLHPITAPNLVQILATIVAALIATASMLKRINKYLKPYQYLFCHITGILFGSAAHLADVFVFYQVITAENITGMLVAEALAASLIIALGAALCVVPMNILYIYIQKRKEISKSQHS